MMIFGDWPWRHWARQRPTACALRLAGQEVDWQQFAQRVTALAAGLAEQGVTAGAVIALRGKNSVEMLYAYLALLQLGARVLPLNPQLPETRLAELLPSLTVAACVDLAGETPITWPASVAVLSLRSRAGEASAAWQPERQATLTLTSGSSGLPKAAVHSAAAHLASAAGVLSLMPLSAQDSWLLSLPLFHVSGQGILWRWLLAGACLVWRPMHPLHQALAGCSHASLVPTQLWRLLQSTQPVALRDVLLGGAMIPLALTQEAEARGIRCWCGYGLTEMASTVCAKRADGLPGVGHALPGREVRLAADGEVLLRGASLACGYWQAGQLRPLLADDGWFHTRDRAVWTAGELCIQGRMDNQFFSGGEGIQPEDIERILLQHPAVSQAFIVPVADAEFGQRPVAVVESEVALTVLSAWLAPRVARFQHPVAWLPLPAALKGGGIKIARRQVQQWAQATYQTSSNAER
ncbi:2-succinylbenzoate--CoA ligase [Edwardsiella hoshinae]|uniref:2-succinylbenzoate--CoA ligase n=2 Tax=Edwardsiella hoshinae TaxID=93378 RepID=A0A376DBM2_9GAMM|nr:2-succinylbenzoate--CoA ligase [Edwardsiella hoshinae]